MESTWVIPGAQPPSPSLLLHDIIKSTTTYREALAKQAITAETGPILLAKPFIWDRNKSDKLLEAEQDGGDGMLRFDPRDRR